MPVLWDKQKGVIVNNESSEILRMFNAEFNGVAKNPSLDLYPKDLRKDIDAVNEWARLFFDIYFIKSYFF